MVSSYRHQKTSGAQRTPILAQSNDRVLGAVSGRAARAIGYADELMVKALESVMGASKATCGSLSFGR